jgi:hypothetical protein
MRVNTRVSGSFFGAFGRHLPTDENKVCDGCESPGYTLNDSATDKRDIFWTVRGSSLVVALKAGYWADAGVQELKTSSTMMR